MILALVRVWRCMLLLVVLWWCLKDWLASTVPLRNDVSAGVFELSVADFAFGTVHCFLYIHGASMSTSGDRAMIWHENVELIVMVTQLREAGRAKCAPYWPAAVGEMGTHGDYTITNTAVVHDDSYQPKITYVRVAATILLSCLSRAVRH